MSGDDQDAACAQDLVGSGGDRSVGRFADDLGADVGRVGGGDLALDGRRDEDLAVQLEGRDRAGEVARSGEAEDAAGLGAMGRQGLEIDAFRPLDAALDLGDADQQGAGFAEVPGAVVADVAQALDHEALALDARLEAERTHVLADLTGLAQAEVDAPAGRSGPAANATLSDRLARDAGQGVELAAGHRLVGVRDPGHLTRARTPRSCRVRAAAFSKTRSTCSVKLS